MLPLDILKLVVLCMEHVHISYDTRVPKVVESVVNNKTTGAARVENGMVGVLDTRAIEVGGGKGSCMKGSAIDGLVLALCPLVDYSVIDQEITDVFGSVWSGVCPNEGKGVMCHRLPPSYLIPSFLFSYLILDRSPYRLHNLPMDCSRIFQRLSYDSITFSLFPSLSIAFSYLPVASIIPCIYTVPLSIE